MSYQQPNPAAPATHPPTTAGWARPLHAGGRHDGPPGGGDDALINLAGVVLAVLAGFVLATAVAVTAVAAYGLITWRRTRWWPPVLLGVVLALVAVAVLGGPGPALDHHLLAARELTAPHPGDLAALLGRRWAAWLSAQLALSVPLGLIAAGFARHRVTHLPAHELSPAAQARRNAEDHAQLRRARRRADHAPLQHRDKPVLGAWVDGDLTDWRSGEWATIPAGTFGLGAVVLGLPGSGKTETLLRLAQLGFAAGYDVHILDAKGDPDTQARFAAIAAAAGQQARLFPQEPYDGWRGDATALRNRFARIVDYTEPYYQDGARVLLHSATATPLRTMDDLINRLGDHDDVDQAVRKGTQSRYRSFSAAVGRDLSGTWAFEDTRASYLLLDGVALGDDTPRLARYLLEDFQHYASNRKTPGRNALLIVDEFSALRVSNAAALLERLRSFGVGVIIASQSVEGLHDDPNEQARLLGAANTLIAHRLADPEPVAARAGTRRQAERSHQLDPHGATGLGSLRIQETYRIDPNDLRNLPAGVAWITTAGRAAKVCVSRGRQSTLASPRHDRRRIEPVAEGNPPMSPNEGVAWDPDVERRTPGNQTAVPTLDCASVTTDRPEEITFVEAQLGRALPVSVAPVPSVAAEAFSNEPTFEQQTLPMDDVAAAATRLEAPPPPAPSEEPGVDPAPSHDLPDTSMAPYFDDL